MNNLKILKIEDFGGFDVFLPLCEFSLCESLHEATRGCYTSGALPQLVLWLVWPAAAFAIPNLL